MTDKFRISDYEHTDYENFWTEAQRKYDNEIEQIVISELLPPSGDWFVDLGCAHGRLTPKYIDRFRNCVLLDYSLRQLRSAREKWGESKNVFFIASNIYELPFVNGIFDGAMMVRVLHHLEEPSVAIERIAKILRPGKHLVINYRNRRDLRNMVRYFIGLKNVGPFRVAHDNLIGPHELQACTHPKLAEKMLKDAGFTINRVRGTSFFGGKFLKLLSNPAILEAPLTPILGGMKLSPLVFVDAKMAGSSNPLPEPPSSFDEILTCPKCMSGLYNRETEYMCESCGNSYPIVDGIVDFRQTGSKKE